MDWPTTIISRRICNLLIFFVNPQKRQPSAMKPDPQRRKNRALSSSSPSKTRPGVSSGSPNRSSGETRGGKLTTSATLLDREETGRYPGSGYDEPNPEPRSFPYNVKQQCWEKAEKIKGRDPERWRRDHLGNIVFRKLVGCPGCLCHDYDHIVPYSKGGKSTLENCQVLQAKVNRSKGNKTDISRAELIQRSSYCRVAGRDMDLIELTAYGNVQRATESSGCRIQ
uniref:HNH nuclease domain-containing protein n=1 Tax=Noccaea caerulescens TaxID=107243 RepID=A0A1J3EF01_NOCCA